MNLTNEVDKPIVKKTVVVYAGRFQPFHKGHYAAYSKLVSKFGKDNVYIGTSNDTSGPKSPFTFNEKKKIATTMFGIPQSRFVNIKNPYKPVEILKGFDSKTTQYVAAVGEKDATRLQGKYFKAYNGKAGYGYEEIGYVYPVPAEQNPISGTDVRNGLGGDLEAAKKFFLKAYPKFNKEIFQMIADKMKTLQEAGPLKGAGMAVDFGKKFRTDNEYEITEDGFPGGAFTGLVSPGGYIGGAPKPKDVKKLSKKLHKGNDTETHQKYVYDPIAEILSNITTEKIFNEFVEGYFGKPEEDKESVSKSKVQNIADFVEYSLKRLKLKDKPNIKLILGQTYSEQNGSLGGYSPETKDIYVVVPKRMTADICRTIAHELVHRKQDEMGYIRNSGVAGQTGSPIENQANSIAGILLRDYGKINKTIYTEGLVLNEVSNMSGGNGSEDRPDGAFLPKGAARKLGARDGYNNSDKWYTNGGYIQLEYPKADAIYGDEDQNKLTVQYVASNLPRLTGPQTKFTKNPDKAKVISEMGRNDIHFKAVFDYYKNGSARAKQLVAMLVTGNKYAKVKEIVKDLMEMEKEDIEYVENRLGISPFNETKQEVYGGDTGGWYGGGAKRWVDDNENDYTDLSNMEDININVNPGDVVRMGKFKNKKVKVKDIGKDQHGMPTINGKQATTFRTVNEGNYIAGGMQDDQSFRSPYTDKWERFDDRAQTHAEIVGYTVIGHTSDSYPQKKKGVVMPSQNPKEENGPGKRWIHPSKGEDYTNEKKEKWEMYPFNSRPQAYAPPPAVGDQIDIFKYTKPKVIKENIEEWNQLLLEGGAYGHMSHPFDDMELTFGQLKDIISKALDGDLGVVREKTDGQALAISWKNGRLIAARNKGHLQNAGANAMGIEDVASKFAGRGGLTDAYNYAMKDLSAAIQILSKGQRDKIFNEGKCFMNIEVIWPTSVNVIPYGQALLVFHNTTCYDESGKAIGADQSAARTLAGMIKQINADVQSKYTIQGPPITSIPKNQNLSSLKGKYLTKLSKLQSEFGLADADTMALYHQSWWENYIDKNAPTQVDKITKESLVKRWAFGDKSFRLNTISNEDIVKWAIDTDKINVAKQQKENMQPFEEIFLGVGADILSFVSSVLTVHPDAAIRNMKDRLKDVAEKVRTAGSPTQIQKFKSELERLNKLGGVANIVASEGLVFFYGGKTYKLTGTFAPLNQLLGIFYE